ncbi:cytochrome c oxidase assembly protein COX11, mitochondrial [Ischnura elegans]|uniref:cytochrome c oxidase assembly protein COX11, mitochondrial n=1 Tax=Ischnura elegans TaxID=197161 RepID=UPI001ED882BA|nr:cytochrome c oxidase assembly protein COX11, mitochondrial [Ischnura elegans]
MNFVMSLTLVNSIYRRSNCGVKLFSNKFFKECVCDRQSVRSLRTTKTLFSFKKKSPLSGTAYYFGALGVLTVGFTYAAVPLYRMFCQASSYGGTTAVGHDADKVEKMKKVKEKSIRVVFNADTAASMRWNFKPQQDEIRVSPGETALAFYTARNPTDSAVIGISTYNVIPFEAGQYFNKIQCFCFEEQLLNPHEEVDMPVFFYIDPDFANDPKMEYVDSITLSYTFFEAKEGLKLPIPEFVKQ